MSVWLSECGGEGAVVVEVGDFQGRERPGEEVNLVDAPAFEAAVAEALTEHQRVRADLLAEAVAKGFLLSGLAVEIDA